MMHYLLRKLLRLILVLLLVAAATFLLLNLLPGDVALALLGNEATPAAIAQVRAELGPRSAAGAAFPALADRLCKATSAAPPPPRCRSWIRSSIGFRSRSN